MLVTIGIPVYNGGKSLPLALDCLVAQDWPDLELIISDNASTDQTEDVCRDYAARDSRIRYYRSARNMGAVANFNRVVDLAHGEFFSWAAHDDLRHPTHVRRCVEALQQHPKATLAYTWFNKLDDEGHFFPSTPTLQNPVTRFLPLGDTAPSRRFEAVIRDIHASQATYGVIRTAALRSTPGMTAQVSCDLVLLAQLSLLGPFVEVPHVLFSYHWGVAPDRREMVKIMAAELSADPRLRGKRWYATNLASAYGRVALEASIPRADKAKCLVHLGHWYVGDRILYAGASKMIHRARGGDKVLALLRRQPWYRRLRYLDPPTA
jgi:glycosyltransferase involved in cell wall biosynthesis